MKIALAQIKPSKGDITANIFLHQQFIEKAIYAQAKAIFFPELSLTGYEPTLARDLSLGPADERLHVFQQLSNIHGIIIGIGAPTKGIGGIHISMLIFQPFEAIQVYSKQLLDPDEFNYFIPGQGQVLITIEDQKLAPAICYESLQTSHVQQAHQQGAHIYLASVAKPQNGIHKANLHYPMIAQNYSMPVLMVNCIGPCDHFLSAGQSATWDKNGQLIDQLDNQTEELLVFNTQ